MNRRWKKCVCALHIAVYLLFLFCAPVRTQAKDAGITDILVTNTPENVLVYFRVTNCFTEEMEEAILAGIPTTFTFTVELYQERDYWTDRKISLQEIKHTIKYDTVKKIFYVAFAEGGERVEQFTEFSKAQTAMSDVNGVSVAPLVHLGKNHRYYLRVKAELDAVKLPLHLEYVFFFVSLWDFETDWYRHDFVY